MASHELIAPEPSVEIYSSLLSEAIKAWKIGTKSEVHLQHPESDGLLEQYVLAKGDNPKNAENLTVGFCMNSKEAYFTYNQRFRQGFVESFGQVITIQHYFESGNESVARQNTGKYKRGPIIRKFSPISAQTVANEFGVRILDTMDIDLTDRGEREKLEALGYSKRSGYQVYEKLYEPEGR